jgi:hypothetical protein
MSMNKINRQIYIAVLIILLIGCNNNSDRTGTINEQTPTTEKPKIDIEAITPTQFEKPLSPTIQPKVVEPEMTKTATSVLVSSQPTGVIYLWIFRQPDPFYTSVDLSNADLPVFVPDWTASALPADQTIIGLGFAPNSSYVVYLTNGERRVELWKASVDLELIERLGSFESPWLESVANPDFVHFKWGPANTSLTMTSPLVQNRIILYSIKEKRAYDLPGKCDGVAPAPDTGLLTVWCSFDDPTKPYGYLTFDGDIVFTKAAPSQEIGIYEWAFSTDAHQIAYIPKEGNVTFGNTRGELVEAPVRYLNPPAEYLTKPSLQWSGKGDRLLVYGYNEQYCPLKKNPISGHLEEHECWLVIDTKTSEILWGPNRSAESIQEVTGIALQDSFSHCAGLSDDGEWVTICYESGAIVYFLIIGVEDNKRVIDFGTENILLDFKWVQN